MNDLKNRKALVFILDKLPDPVKINLREVTNVQRIYSSFICCILSFIMTFTGMCMDTKQASSFFQSSTLGTQTNLLIKPDDETITSEVKCTQKMLGISESTFISSSVEHQIIWTKIRNSLLLVIVYKFCQRNLYLHMVIERICVSKACLKAIIVNYIHKQDGKK